jgi:hypothetical protein
MLTHEHHTVGRDGIAPYAGWIRAPTLGRDYS